MSDHETEEEEEVGVLGSDVEEEEEEEEVDSEEEEELQEGKSPENTRPRNENKRKKKRKKKGSQFIEEEAMEDSDEDEEDEAGGEGPSKKRSKFIDDMAAIGDDDEEIEDFDMEDPFLMDEQAEVDAVKATNMNKMYREMDTRDRFQTDEDLEKFVQERYMGREDEYNEVDEDLQDGEVGEVTAAEQRALQPTVRDPFLWLVKVKRGKESEIVIRIMQKAIVYENRRRENGGKGPRLQITSVVHHSNLKGYIYVEARKANAVKLAIKGMQDVYASYDATHIPLKEMADALTLADNKAILCDVGDWVKMRGGEYKGDLAKVVWSSDTGERIMVKVVPRLDFAEMAARKAGAAAKMNKMRTPAKAFNRQEARKYGLGLSTLTSNRLGTQVLECAGKQFSDGYLLKEASVKTVMHVKPTYDEILKFNEMETKAGADNNDDPDEGIVSQSDALRKTLQDARDVENENQKDLTAEKAAHTFSKGDTVIVARGELQNLVGTVDRISAHEGIVHIKPDHKDLTDLLPIDAMLLEKYFTVGKHVKVVSGKYEGSTGMVVAVNDTVAVVFSDMSQQEMKVFMRDLVDCVETSHGLTKYGEYTLLDLVQLSTTESGVIVGVEKDCCMVLLTSGKTEKKESKDIARKVYASKLTGFDGWNNIVNSGDVVKIVSGDFAGKQGTVKHVAKNNFLFVECRDVLENLGIICVKAKSCDVVGGDKNRAGGAGGRSRGREVTGAVPKSFNALQRESPLIGKSIIITKGPYKSYKGKVMDANDRMVRVQLEAQPRVVTVKHKHLSKEHQAVLRSNFQAPRPMFSMPATVQGGRNAFSSMAAGAQTPMHSGMMAGGYGSQTPMHHSGASLLSPFRISESAPEPSSKRGVDEFSPGLLMNVVCYASHLNKYGKVVQINPDNSVTLQLGTYSGVDGFQPRSQRETHNTRDLELAKPVENGFVRILGGDLRQHGNAQSKLISFMDAETGLVRDLGDMSEINQVAIPLLGYVVP